MTEGNPYDRKESISPLASECPPPRRELQESAKETPIEEPQSTISVPPIINQKPKNEDSYQIAPELREYITRTKQEQTLEQERFNNLRKEIPDFERLESEFYQISPNTLFFDTKLQDEILEVIKKRFETLKQIIPGAKTLDFWNETEIDRMFGKGFNPTSLVTSAESAEWFSAKLELDGDEPLMVAELGCGAGWSTTMLFRNLEKIADGRKQYINSIDMSPHAIATTQTLLEYYGISYIIIANNEQRKQISRLIQTGELDSCVLLNLGNFDEILEKYPEDYFHGIYSTHGSAYLSEKEYEKVLSLISKKGKNDAIFVADSLNPLYTNRLSTPILLLQMLFPKVSKKILNALDVKYIFARKGLNNTSKYFPQNSEVKVIRIFNEERADLIINWANYLIRTLRIKRLLETKKSLSVTMDVVERYRSDVFPSTQLNRVVKNINMNANKTVFEELTNKPDFTIFLETIGFRVNK
ncbi:MAG: hypothetical protein PHW82_16860 [Bacteroidales bacterium]|nr:hypothetical protein [Bacteroidales bacterium]